MSILPGGRPDTIPNYFFLTEIEMIPMSFSKISSLGNRVEFDSIQEGGRNDGAIGWAKPIAQVQVTTFEKGIVRLGPREIANIKLLTVGHRLKLPIQILVMRGMGSAGDLSTVRRFTLENCMITGWELGDLDAMGNEVLVERIEIAHSGVVRKLV